MTDPQIPILYGFWRSSATCRVRVALNLKGLAYTERIVDLDAGEQRGADYLALNPQGALPLLVVPGHPPLGQSLAILEFLEEYRAVPPLLPQGLDERARARSLAAMLASDTHPLITPRIRGYLRHQLPLDDAAWRAWQTHWLHTGLAAFEQRLAREPGAGTFCVGDAVTIADICLASIFAVMDALKIAPPDGLPTISRIVARARALPAFAAASPFRQAGAPSGQG